MANAPKSVATAPHSRTLAKNMTTLMDGMGIGALREKMAEKGLAIGQGTVARALAGDVGVRLGSLGKIARFFDVTADDLLSLDLGKGGDGSLPPEFTAVKRVDVKFSNGVGIISFEEDDKPPLVFRKDFLRNMGIAEGDAVVVDGAGPSNEPKIPDGSVVLLNKGDRETLNGDFFAFRVDGELLIKRLQKIPGVGILATAENPNFKPKQRVYTDADGELKVIGRAKWVGTSL